MNLNLNQTRVWTSSESCLWYRATWTSTTLPIYSEQTWASPLVLGTDCTITYLICGLRPVPRASQVLSRRLDSTSPATLHIPPRLLDWRLSAR